MAIRFWAGEDSRSLATSYKYGVSLSYGIADGMDRHVTYPDVVFKLDSSGGVELDLLQSLSYNIVRLAFAGLCCLDGSGLV